MCPRRLPRPLTHTNVDQTQLNSAQVATRLNFQDTVRVHNERREPARFARPPSSSTPPTPPPPHQVESLGERWGTFLERHGGALASADLLDATYLEQTDAFLKGVGLESIEEFVVVLDDAHGRMRADADRAP